MLHACVSLLQGVQDGTLGCKHNNQPHTHTHAFDEYWMSVMTASLQREGGAVPW